MIWKPNKKVKFFDLTKERNNIGCAFDEMDNIIKKTEENLNRIVKMQNQKGRFGNE